MLPLGFVEHNPVVNSREPRKPKYKVVSRTDSVTGQSKSDTWHQVPVCNYARVYLVQQFFLATI